LPLLSLSETTLQTKTKLEKLKMQRRRGEGDFKCPKDFNSTILKWLLLNT